MSVPVQSQVFNPISGVFGNGNVRIFTSSGTWNVPPGVANVRARCFGAGGSNSGSGGGFTMLAIYGLSGVTSVAVTVGAAVASTAGGTSSFGSYCSATGGGTAGAAAGTGIGGDINTTGGLGASGQGGGGVASLFGDGGRGGISNGFSGASGGGASTGASTIGGSGFFGSGGLAAVPAAANLPTFSIDFIGTGGGGALNQPGINGGGGGGTGTSGGYPGGGSGTGTGGIGAAGMVIVEW